MTEVNAADTAAMSGDLNAAVTDFVKELKEFRGDMERKLQLQEGRMNMFERKNNHRGRLPLSNRTETEMPHQKAFSAYLRHGDDDGLRGLVVEEKGLTVAGDGGFLVAPKVADAVQSVLHQGASLRRLANVVTVESASYEVLIDKGELGAGWAGEDAVAETAAGGIEKISIQLHELSAMPKASQRLLDDAAFDIETWLAERIADRFARSEAAAFITGDGVGKPKGFLNYPIVSAKTAGDGEIGFVESGSFGKFADINPADCLIDLIYSLGAEYRANANFVMNSRTAAEIRKMKDADGRFFWADGLSVGQPAQLLGYPVLICEDMPDVGPDAPVVAFGDFRAAYTIAERPDLRVLRDPFSAKPHVLFYATKRVGGGVTDFRAIRLLQLS